MGKLEKYTSYRNSGVEWLGEIPEHWEVLPFKSLLRRNGLIRGPFGSALQTSFFVESGYKVYEQKNAIYNDLRLGKSYINKSKYNELKRFEVFSNDFLMSCSGTIGKLTKVPVSFEKGIINQAMLIIRTKNKEILDDFFEYLFTSEYILNTILDNSLGSAMKNLVGMPIFKNIKIPLPPKQEQTKIASYLDEKTSQIDKAINQKEKLIELLKEQKQITINEAVTKGLDKDVEYKDSDIEWIGVMPKHWDLLANKYIFKIKKDTVGKRSSEYSLLSLTLKGIIKRDLDGGGKFPAEFDTYQEVKQGDFVFCLFDVEETPRTVGLSEYDGMITGAYTVMSVQDMDRKYLYYFYLNLDSKKRLKPLYKGLRNTIPKDSFFSFKTFVPPKDEQVKIVEYIETQTAKIDKAIELQQNYIAKLKEYKASLINSVVTGKVRVA